jgi:hypothetical protein
LQLNRDGLIRTLGDLMQLVRVIEIGVDIEGDGSRELDSSRIYYFGASLGGIYATVLAAVEPRVRATVANVAGGALIENRRLMTGSDSFRSRLADLLAARQPSLVNNPGITRIAGVTLPGPRFFNENMPLRNGIQMIVGLEGGANEVIQSPVINDKPGAMALQEWFDRAAWAAQSTNPVAYAPHCEGIFSRASSLARFFSRSRWRISRCPIRAPRQFSVQGTWLIALSSTATILLLPRHPPCQKIRTSSLWASGTSH